MRMSRVVLALLVTAMIGAGGCGRFKSAEGLYQDAISQHDKGEMRAAVIQLKNAIEKDPQYAPARYLLAVVYNEQGLFSAAEKEARKALELGFDKGPATLEVARALLGQGQAKQALEALPTSGWSNEMLAKIMELRGSALLMLGDVAPGADAFKQALAIAPASPGATYGLARVALSKGDADEARKLLDQGLAKSPGDVDSLLLKGNLQNRAGKPGEAAATFNEVLKARKEHVGALLNLASLAIEANKLGEARALIEKARKAQPSNLVATYMIALVDFREGKLAQARDNVLLVLKYAPGHLPSAVLLSAVSFELGLYEQAEQKLSPVLERLPQNLFARRLLAATQLRQGKAQLALETLGPLLTPQADASTLSLAGEIHSRLKDQKKATEYFDRAARALPQNASAQARLGVSQLASGDVESGIAELEKASRMDPKQTQADGALIASYLRLQQYDKAMAAIDALEKKTPNTAQVQNLRGTVYLGKRDLVNARKHFEQALAIDPAFIPAAQNLAQLDVRDKKPDDARRRFENVLSKDKTNITAMLALADLAAAQNKEKDYLEWVDRAAKADPKALEPKARQIAHFLRKKEASKALSLAHEVQSAHGDNPQAWDLLGRTQLAAGEKENAIASFTKLTQLAPDAPRGFADLGGALASAARWDEARSAFGKALTLNADFLDARRALIALEMQQGRAAAALKLAQEQTGRQPKSALGPALEGEVLMAQKQYAQAAKAYDRALALAKTSALAIKAHQAAVLAGNAGDADNRLLAWLKEQPRDLEARAYLAGSLMERKDYKRAAEHYEIAAQALPDNALILNNLAVVYGESKDGRALATAERAYQRQPKAAAIQDTFGWILLGQGQTARALSLLKEAAATSPNAPEIHYHYAEALLKSGDKAQAKRELDAALKAPGGFPARPAAEALRRQL